MLANMILIITYALIAVILMGSIASEGVDEDGNVYDDTAITCGIALGLIWPITFFAFLMNRFAVNLGIFINRINPC